MIADRISIITTVVTSIGAFVLQCGGSLERIQSKCVKDCLAFPKTSKCQELKNKLITKITVPSFSDAGLTDNLHKEIKKDLNMKIYGVTSDVLTALRCLISDRDDILLSALDYFVISKMGMEVLIVENKEKGSYDRSLFIDLNDYRQAVFKYQLIVSIVIGFITLFATGNEAIRKIIGEVFSTFVA